MINRVKSERSLKGWTQSELAEKVSVNVSTVIRWESGGSIPQEKMIKLRELFGCDLDWLIGVSDLRQTILQTN